MSQLLKDRLVAVGHSLREAQIHRDAMHAAFAFRNGADRADFVPVRRGNGDGDFIDQAMAQTVAGSRSDTATGRARLGVKRRGT